jgi:diguanylate cyclase
MTKPNEKFQDYEILIKKMTEMGEELHFLLADKEKKAAELLIANQELVFQNSEKEKRAAELLIANLELVFQNSEKGKIAAELLLANKELIFQNSETEKRVAELYWEKQLFAKTLLSIDDGVITTDLKRNVLFMNRVAENITGWSKEEALGTPIYSIFNIMDEYSRVKDQDLVERAIKSKMPHDLANHTILISRDGKENLIEDSVAPILNVNNEVEGVVIVFRDFSEKWNRLKQIEYLNFHDDLTGLYNRRFFEEEMLRVDVKRNLPISIIMGDTNGLKLINDSFGHKIGDELLKKTAAAIKKGCREDDIIARVGGDEFVILLLNSNASQTVEVIERIKASIAKLKIGKIGLSVSFGYGTKNVRNKGIRDILIEAEDTMYKNKLSESSSMRSKTIELICETLFSKNKREMDHCTNVSNISIRLSKKLGFDKDHISTVKLIGLMHDIGKIGIEDTILNKMGSLTTQELGEMKKHPEIGYRILGSAQEFSDIATSVLQHHERWDGLGYPQGLKGNEITLEARIICIADAYDAMTSKRTYKQQKNKDDAIKEIAECAGTQFDPVLANVFVKMMVEDQ